MSQEKGWLFAQPPRRSRPPDVVVLNKTVYREEAPGSPVYKSEGGEVLNLTTFGG